MLTRLITYEASRQVRHWVSRLGLNVRLAANARPLDFRNRPNIDPIAALYEAGTRPVILRVPLQQCVSEWHLAFPCHRKSAAPKVQTLLSYANGLCCEYPGSPLEYFYTHFMPKSAAELMDLNAPSYSAFSKLPPTAALLPWQPYTPQRAVQLQQKASASEARQHGTSRNAAPGNQLFGPVSAIQGKLEFGRLVSTYKSVGLRGLDVDKEGFNNICAVCLANDETAPARSYFIVSGVHRVAAITALGFEYVDLQLLREGLGGVIRRGDARYWPTVKEGYFTESEAVALFDRLFTGSQPQLFHKISWPCLDNGRMQVVPTTVEMH